MRLLSSDEDVYYVLDLILEPVTCKPLTKKFCDFWSGF